MRKPFKIRRGLSALLLLILSLLIVRKGYAFRLLAPLRREGLGSSGPYPATKRRRSITSLPRRMQPSMLAQESFVIPPPEKVLQAVERAGGRVTVQDVAAVAGVDMATAQKGLVKLATVVEGELEVGKDGDLVYRFPRNFRTVLRTRSLTQQAKEVWNKVSPLLFYLTRVSFGLCLILSLALVFLAITFAGSASFSTGGDRDEDRRRDRGDLMYRGPSFYFGPSPFDFFFYRPYGYYYTRSTGLSSDETTKEPDQMGFLESCFSYIFGDGNPNADIEETRYRLIANVIRKNGGAVVLEQLAPYLDVPAPLDRTGYAMAGSGPLTTVMDESYVLPVLTRLNGRPEVTPDGNIVYVFPDFMISAMEGEVGESMDAKWARQEEVDRELLQYQDLSAFKLRELVKRNRIPADDCYDKRDLLERLKSYLLTAPSSAQVQGTAPYLYEETIPFSLAPASNRVFAAILGVANLVGVLVLGSILRDSTLIYGSHLPGILGLSKALYAPLLIYAMAFNVVPFFRSLWVKEKNAEIEKRNENRKSWAKILGRAIGPLYEKILSARNYRSEMKVVKRKDITYTTSKSAMEQGAGREAEDLQEFDRQIHRGGAGRS